MVKLLTTEDTTRIAEVFYHTHEMWSETQVRGELCNPCSLLMGAEQGGELVAVVAANFVLDEGNINNLVTLPRHRKRGCARVLLLHLFAELKERGVQKLFLEVRRSNEAAINLYTGLGFDRVGERKGFYSGPVEDAVLYMKKL